MSVEPKLQLNPVVIPNSNFLASARVLSPKCCAIEQDKVLREPILVMKGDLSLARVQLPREVRPQPSLQLKDFLVTSQIFLSATDHFALELALSQSPAKRLKLIIGTNFRDAKHEASLRGVSTLKLPLMIPRSKWVQVVFHIGGIISGLFNLSPFKSIDSITLCGTAKIGRVYSASDEQICIDSTPEGITLFAVPAYSLPIWTTATRSNTADDNSTPSCDPLENSISVMSKQRELGSSTDSRDKATVTTLNSGSSRGLSLPARLEPLGTKPSLTTQGTALASITDEQKCVDEKVRLTQPTLPISAYFDTRTTTLTQKVSSPPSYIRIVDDCQSPPPAFPNPNTAAPRRFMHDGSPAQRDVESSLPQRTGGLLTCAPLPEWNDVSGWSRRDDSEPEATSPIMRHKGEAPSKSTSKPKAKTTSNVSERAQRIVASRKRKIAVTNRPSGKPSTVNEAPVRKSKARRRMQILRQNESRFIKLAAARALLPSEVHVCRDDVLPPPTGAEGDVAVSLSAEPKFGYGFGYLGILHEDGQYEEDEAAALCMKGALTLQLSDNGE